jgi:phage tail tube protein FII
LVEIYGNSQIFLQSGNSIKLISVLRGMIKEIKPGEQKKVKRLTMQCINLCKKIIKEIEEKESVDIDFKLL